MFCLQDYTLIGPHYGNIAYGSAPILAGEFNRFPPRQSGEKGVDTGGATQTAIPPMGHKLVGRGGRRGGVQKGVQVFRPLSTKFPLPDLSHNYAAMVADDRGLRH